MSLDLFRSPTLDVKFNRIDTPTIITTKLILKNSSATTKANGNETLVAGTKSVSTILSEPKVFISLMRTSDPLAPNVGHLSIRNRTGTGFDIVSSNPLDVGDVSWLLFNGG
jgi:hypothetical protein